MALRYFCDNLGGLQLQVETVCTASGVVARTYARDSSQLDVLGGLTIAIRNKLQKRVLNRRAIADHYINYVCCFEPVHILDYSANLGTVILCLLLSVIDLDGIQVLLSVYGSIF